jgi:hypothetical protein
MADNEDFFWFKGWPYMLADIQSCRQLAECSRRKTTGRNVVFHLVHICPKIIFVPDLWIMLWWYLPRVACLWFWVIDCQRLPDYGSLCNNQQDS